MSIFLFFLKNFKTLTAMLAHFMPLVSFCTPENIKKRLVFDVFRGYRKKPVVWNGLNAMIGLSYSSFILISILFWK